MIRQALPSDDLLTPIQAWVATSNGEAFGLRPDAGRMNAYMQSLILRPNSTVFVLLKEDVVQGFIGVVIYECNFSYDRIGAEQFWYVYPEYRGASSIMLMAKAQKWAKQRGCTHFLGGVLKVANRNPGSVESTYEDLGMIHFGSTYINELGG